MEERGWVAKGSGSMNGKDAGPKRPRTGPGTSGRRPLSRGKRLAFTATALILGWLACEVAGYCGYWLWNGTPFSWSAYQKERVGRTSVVEGSGVLAQVHPYVGFVEEPRRRRAGWCAQRRRCDPGVGVRLRRRQDADPDARAGQGRGGDPGRFGRLLLRGRRDEDPGGGAGVRRGRLDSRASGSCSSTWPSSATSSRSS